MMTISHWRLSSLLVGSWWGASSHDRYNTCCRRSVLARSLTRLTPPSIAAPPPLDTVGTLRRKHEVTKDGAFLPVVRGS